MNDKEIRPITITNDRYNGCYSGGKYLAWNLKPYEIPLEAFADDVNCKEFWEENKLPVGKGETIDDAIKNLLCIILEKENRPG